MYYVYSDQCLHWRVQGLWNLGTLLFFEVQAGTLTRRMLLDLILSLIVNDIFFSICTSWFIEFIILDAAGQPGRYLNPADGDWGKQDSCAPSVFTQQVSLL